VVRAFLIQRKKSQTLSNRAGSNGYPPMMADHPFPSGSHDDGIPEKLASDLRRAFGPLPTVPSGFDERVLGAASRRLSRRAVGRGFGMHLIAGGAIAAMVGISARVWFEPVAHGPRAFAQGDVNRDGVVNVLDAMALALAVERGGPGGVDLNADNRIDDADVRLLTAKIVSLTPGEGSQG